MRKVALSTTGWDEIFADLDSGDVVTLKLQADKMSDVSSGDLIALVRGSDEDDSLFVRVQRALIAGGVAYIDILKGTRESPSHA